MIDNLKDAITHAREVAEKQRGYTKSFGNRPVTGAAKNYVNLCLECASEHEQLAKWLEELVERREAVNRLEEVAKEYKDSLFGDGICFALKIIGEPRKRDWEREE